MSRKKDWVLFWQLQRQRGGRRTEPRWDHKGSMEAKWTSLHTMPRFTEYCQISEDGVKGVEIAWTANKTSDQDWLWMGRGRGKLIRQGVQLGEDVFVSSLQVFEGWLYRLQWELRQQLQKLIIIRPEKDENGTSCRFQGSMGKGYMPYNSDEVCHYKVQRKQRGLQSVQM